ncbi:UNVERIFIED_CONTAM: hypothetical protein Slati_3337600 [Sesamum latifolium]|uniref:GBF-interacting protein 1 N-terminal domain-containing protein n=1 Tax=Sesamum latifolium TaxID=2727402 RepID=A0AAW2UEM0_9LAMI
MVSGSRIEGGAQVLSAGMRRTIQSIKEIVGNHSDADIYVALKETNMDPNETTQKLLNQSPCSGKPFGFFYEVRCLFWDFVLVGGFLGFLDVEAGSFDVVRLKCYLFSACT